MKIVTDLSITSARHRPRYRWNPSALFDTGAQGAWFDPSDQSTLFQDAALTMPVTVPGQPVGGILDKSGNNNHARQAINAARPIYRTHGARHWLEFDGVDDRLQMDAGLNLNGGTIYLALAEPVGRTNTVGLISAGTGGYISIALSGASRALGKNAGGQVRNIDTPSAFPMTQMSAVAVQVDGGTLHARRAGDPTVYVNAVAGQIGLASAQHLMAYSSAGQLPARVDFFGAVLLPDAVTGDTFERTLAFMNTRIAA